MAVDAELGLDQGVTGRQIAAQPRCGDGLAGRRGRDGQLEGAAARGAGMVQARLDAQDARLPVRADEEVVDAEGGRRDELDGVHDAALVPRAARGVGHDLVAVGRLVEDDAVNGRVGRVEDAHGEAVRLLGADGLRHVEDEGALPALVPAHGDAVGCEAAGVVGSSWQGVG